MTEPDGATKEPSQSDAQDPAGAPPEPVLDQSMAAIGSRPIVVRRSSLFERFGRKVRERRKAIFISVVAALATVLLMAGSVTGWRLYTEWRLGRIELTTEGAPVVCQVLAETSDDPIGEPFDLVTRAIVSLPAGEYRLRVNGMGRLGRTYRFAVNRGETQTHAISIDEGRLLGGQWGPGTGGDERSRDVPIPFAPVTAALELTAGKADLIEWSRNSLIRRDGATSKVVWDALHPVKPFGRNRDPSPWLRKLSPEHRQGNLVESAPDLDGDGIGDILFSIPSSSAFLAFSGKDGSMLWNYAAELEGPGGPQPDGPVLNTRDKPSVRGSHLIGAPELADLDRDGSPDLIATVSFAESRREVERRSAQASSSRPSPSPSQNQQALARRVVVAVSGRSGRRLWSYPIDKTFGTFSHRAWKQPAALVPGKSALVAFVDGTQWVGLDPATGRPQVGPIDLGFAPLRPVQHADLDGDGKPEILALGPGADGGELALAAVDVKTGRPRWVEPGNRMYEESDLGPAPDWPIVVDLDADGRPEIVVPNFGVMPPLSGYRGVRLLDGLTGRTRWARPMRPDTKAGDGLSQIIVAPDLDGDGTRDLITASTFEGKNPSTTAGAQPEEPERVYVDALSGKDGRPLWWWHVETPAEKFTRVWKPRWWGRGPDGWPLLAVPLGGRHAEGMEAALQSYHFTPPVVHLLEASTGREAHTLTGLTRASLADLDGDGLADLWGEVHGELRAFRGELPEAWRALGQFHPPDERYGSVDVHGHPAVDFDGDGIGDALIAFVRAPGASASQPTGSHTALARSGRDGHVIWKTVLDPQESWFEPSRGEYYGLQAFPLTAGDFNGDGTPDVIVHKQVSQRPGQVNRRAATLPLQLLSGRTGRPLWSAGPLPLGFLAQGYSQIEWVEARAVEPDGAPDLLVRHGSPFVKPGSTPLPANSPGRPSLARISGRDGRILWDRPLAEYAVSQVYTYVVPPGFGDFDSDGGLDALMVLPPIPGAGQPSFELLAISLRDGKRLWSQTLRFQFNFFGDIHVGDLDGDKRPDVVVMEELPKGNTLELEIRAFDGRDGKARWAWNAGAEWQSNRPGPMSELADLNGDGTRRICVNFKEVGGMRRIVVLDGNGKECARRDVIGDYNSTLKVADVNGDGRDELLVWYGDRLRAWGRDLSELWSWPNPAVLVEKILPASPARPGAVIINPALALDGSTGRPRWTGQASLGGWPPQFAPKLLDPGDDTRLPLMIGDGLGASVCRVGMPMTSEGVIEAPRGTPARPGRIPDDPRWTRPLPWLAWLKGPVGPWGFLAAGGLAIVNVALPLLILRLVAGRRRFSIRALMALPVAATIPLMVYLTLEPMLPVGPSPLLASEKRLFIAGTLAGLPIVLAAMWVGWCLARGRWRPPATLAGLTILTSCVIAAAWMWFDMKSMPSIERYGRQGWYLVVLPGAYAASVFVLFGWALGILLVWVRRMRREASRP